MNRLPAFTFEGFRFSGVPHGLAATLKVPAAGWEQGLAFAGHVEELADFEAFPGVSQATT